MPPHACRPAALSHSAHRQRHAQPTATAPNRFKTPPPRPSDVRAAGARQTGPVVLIKVAKAEPVRLILRQPRRRHAGLGVLCQGHVRFSVERVEAESAGGVLQLQHVDAADIDGGLGQVCVIVTATAVLVGAALSGTRPEKSRDNARAKEVRAATGPLGYPLGLARKALCIVGRGGGGSGCPVDSVRKGKRNARCAVKGEGLAQGRSICRGGGGQGAVCCAGEGHEATDTGLAYAPVSQPHGHHHIVQCFSCCIAAQTSSEPLEVAAGCALRGRGGRVAHHGVLRI